MYFKILSIAYGVLMILKGPVVHFLGRRWARLEPGVVYPEKQPFWVWGLGVGGLIVAAVTWRMHVKTDVDYSLIVTVVVTLTLLKLSQVLFNYKKFRAFTVKVTKERPGYLLWLNVALAVLGIGLVLLGIFVY